ncbi:MAG: tRNA (adenosine(37)-N6)-dimethylallyltransferase MiaA [Clostridiales bacterium]|jgi:tRNA dimethylallyltransferase|nr:tRNA (adenosine(37)-N6)-dimethylallyltransferase MiaA [Clostridiales bacterium]
MEEHVLVVTGQTASGKTAYAVRRAKESGAEIVSADSMQIYRPMDIGTAKATVEERQGVPHHMIDVAEPDESFSVARYQAMANDCIKDILSRGRRVIVVGGTGLYISALIYNIRYPVIAGDPAYRERLRAAAREEGGAARLFDRLRAVDPQAAQKLHENDEKRVIRALEVFETTGRTISEFARESRATPPEYRFEVVGLAVPRDELYDRINRRVDDMLRRGLVDEARFLVGRYGRAGTAMQAIGYKELVAYLDGRLSLAEAVEKIKTGTRRYAKRQSTWFRAIPEITWIDT